MSDQDPDSQPEEESEEQGPPTYVPTFFIGVIILTEEATDTLIANGINTFEDFIQMSNKDVTGMCDKCKHPGRMKLRGGSGRNANELIPDKGAQIRYLQGKSLRQLNFYIRWNSSGPPLGLLRDLQVVLQFSLHHTIALSVNETTVCILTLYRQKSEPGL